MSQVLLAQADALHLPLRDSSVHCCVCSPPYYGLRSYGVGTDKGEIGLEATPDAYIAAMVQVFREVRRVLRPDGSLWLNCGDSYSSGNRQGHGTRQGYKQQTNRGMNGTNDPLRAPQPPGLADKNLLGVPWRLALALQADGWILRSAITWCKTAPMPESVQDRPTSATEMIFLLTKQPTYFYDATAVRVENGTGWHGSSFMSPQDVATKQGLGQQARCERPGRNLWNYWILGPEPSHHSHYACFPTALVRRCLLAGSPAQVCSACGQPWVRQVERQRLLDGHIPVSGTFARPDEPFRIPPNGKGHYRYSTATTDHGFLPSCACNAPPGLATILDPFVGSGTTLLVARELGRHGIGLDLSATYLTNITRHRLNLDTLDRWLGIATSPPPPVRYDDLPLFAEDTP